MTGVIISASMKRAITAGILLVIAVDNFLNAFAWLNTPIKYSQRPHNRRYLSHSTFSKGWSTTQLLFRDDENDSIEIKKKSAPPANDFQSRMKRVALQRNRTNRSSSSRRSTGKAWRPPNVRTADSLEDFAKIIQEGRTEKKLVVVRFYATWCKVRVFQFCLPYCACY